MVTWKQVGWIAFVVVGWIVNVCFLAEAASESPEGAMGMGFLLVPCLVPWAMPVLFLIAKFVDLFK